jgi:hypothetical protein
MPEITLPHNQWAPRRHQMPLWRYLHEGGKRAVAIWHRRAGKDEVSLHRTAVAAMQRPGNYVHCLPEYLQGRRAIWTAINPHTGKRRIDEAFPFAMRTHTNDATMFLRLANGSTWSVIGSDRYDTSLVGTSVAGIVFSEYALANPSAWAYARPVLEENNGWAIFISTPRGRNHAYEMYKHAGKTSGWFSELLTVRDTGMLSEQQLAETLAEYRALYGGDHGDAFYNQEFFCDFSVALFGAFFVGEMAQVRREGRVMEIEPIAGQPVHTAWDIGHDTSIWWWQACGGQLLLLDHWASSTAVLELCRDEIVQREKERGWTRGYDYVPHDAKVKEWGTGRTRVETMRALGLNPVLVPLATLEDGINAIHRTLPLCVFHPRCELRGLPALEQYRRQWDDERKCFQEFAVHDWTSHDTDAFRYMALSWRPAPLMVAKDAAPRGWTILPPAEARKGMRL